MSDTAPSGPEPSGSIVSGTIFAGYRIEAEIGRGGMGVVYRARHLALDRERALKVISPALSTDPHFRERFQREARLAASLEHPNVVPVDHAGDEGGVLYLSMRLVEGSDLRRIVEAEGPLDARRASQLLAGVAAGLDAAHERGLLHRDVKPANVLVEGVNGDERVFLTDFGISRIAGGGGPSPPPASSWAARTTWRPSRWPAIESTTARTSTPSDACSTSRSPGSHRSLATTTWRSSSPTPTRPARGPRSSCLACRPRWTGWWRARWPSVPSIATRAPASSPRTWRASSAARSRVAADGTAASAPRLRGGADSSPAATSWPPHGRRSSPPASPWPWRAASRRCSSAGTNRVVGSASSGPLPVATVQVGRGPTGLAVAPARLWVASSGASALYAIDLVNNRQARPPVPAGGDPVSVGVAFDSVWALNRDSSTLLRLEHLNRSAPIEIPVGDESLRHDLRQALGLGREPAATTRSRESTRIPTRSTPRSTSAPGRAESRRAPGPSG